MSREPKLQLCMLVVSALCITLASCATDQAAKVRGDKPATVGIWGGGYRPKSTVGVVADVSGAVTRSTNYSHVEENGEIKSNKDTKPNAQNIQTQNSQRVDVGLHLYPFQTSAFFYGLAVNRRKQISSFDSENEGSSLAKPSYSNIQVSDNVIAVGPALGWDWIWPNGISVLWDFGPRWDVSKQRQVIDQAENGTKVDQAQRDKIIKKLDGSKAFQIVDTHLIVGYSF